MSAWKAEEAELIWHGDYPADIVERVKEDIAEWLGDLDHASDLIFHHVFLDEEDVSNGPLVTIWGVEGSDAFHCEYCEKPDWVHEFGEG